MHVRITDRLSFRHARDFILIVLAVGLCIGLLQTAWGFIGMRREMEQSVRQLVLMLEDSAVQAAYEFDNRLAEKVVGGLFQHRQFAEVQLISDFGDILAKKSRKHPQWSLEWLAALLPGKDMQYDFPLHVPNEKKQVGQIRVIVDDNHILASAVGRAGMVVVNTIVPLAFLGFFLLLRSYYSLAKPLLKMAGRLAQIDPEEPRSSSLEIPREHAHDELGLLVATVNRVLSSCDASISYRRRIMESMPSGILIIDESGRVVSSNPAAESLLGYPAGRLSTMSIREILLLPEDPAMVSVSEAKDFLRLALQFHAREAGIQGGDGGVIPVELRFSPLRYSGKLLQICVIHDIRDRKQAENAVLEAKIFLDKIINSIADPIFVKDRQHRWILLNDAFCSFKGRSRQEMIGKTEAVLSGEPGTDEGWHKDEEVFLSKLESVSEETATGVDNAAHTLVTTRTLYVNEQGEQYLVGIIRDVTEQKRLEGQLRQAVKMEAIGTLAGGVAHDFNNLMTAVLGYSDIALQRVGEDVKMRKDLEQIREAGRRAAALTSQLLAFSRKQVVQPRLLNLNSVLADTEKMLKRLIGEDIDLVCMPDPELLPVMADPDLLGQIIMNLAINARDAMPSGGKLTIETDNVYLDEEYARHHFEIVPGNYVMIAVSDTGCGMDKATLSRIFEPFFTTKVKGKGTGLGLAVVFGIVKQSGGHIWVYSEPGCGATFKIYLPAAADGAGAVEQKTSSALALTEGSETILLVEDDEAVRELAAFILDNHGHTVLVAQNGGEAIEICTAMDGPLDLLVTDVIMPGMNGRELAGKIQALSPATKVLYISGYTDNAIIHHGVLDEGTAFLQKPFTPETLLHKVRSVLDEPYRNGGQS